METSHAMLGAAEDSGMTREEYEAYLKGQVNLYGLISIALTAAMPALWRLYLIDATNGLSTTGYKVAAYINLFTWSPYAGAILLFWLSGGSEIFDDWIVSTMRFSVLGPWFINPFAIYVIGKTGLSDTSTVQIGAMVSYVTYSLLMMVL